MISWNKILTLTASQDNLKIPKVVKSNAEWESLLSPEVYRVTRLHGTERPYSGEYCHLFEPGKYACICCDKMLFDSSDKFDSGTGWPSFSQPADESAVTYKKDTSFGMIRIEISCENCGAHLGHVFPDGPPPTNLRYCLNSLSLKKINHE
jgi:methionine-R-sulfoxide reductase